MYAHLSRIDVREGQELSRGFALGLTGTAGTGPHLHFELRTGATAGTVAGPGYTGYRFVQDKITYRGITYLRPLTFIAANLA